MPRISSMADLAKTIEYLGEERENKRVALQEGVMKYLDDFKPANLLRTKVDNFARSGIIDTLIAAASGLLTGFITKKLIVGKSKKKTRKLVGSVMQFVVTLLVARKSESISSFTDFLVRSFIQSESDRP